MATIASFLRTYLSDLLPRADQVLLVRHEPFVPKTVRAHSSVRPTHSAVGDHRDAFLSNRWPALEAISRAASILELEERRQIGGRLVVVPRHQSKDFVRRRALGVMARRHGSGVDAIVPR